MKRFEGTFEDIISTENLLEAWQEFLNGKRGKRDVQEFGLRLTDKIAELYEALANGTYRHGGYHAFNISDPKPRNIHKASVRDRLLHHALYRKLYPFFDRSFVADSFSCRKEKGTHKAIERFGCFAHAVSCNNTRTCWVLKCDIRKFFANINHSILLSILALYIADNRTMVLFQRVIDSFETRPHVGLPLGNLTSQLLVNIYMNEFDQFVKHQLKVKYYIRYADDFVIFSRDKGTLARLLPAVRSFLEEKLKLSLHPDKVFITTLASGVDFLGWVHFPGHHVLRTTTKRRMFKRMKGTPTPETTASYIGLLKHGNTHKLLQQVIQ